MGATPVHTTEISPHDAIGYCLRSKSSNHALFFLCVCVCRHLSSLVSTTNIAECFIVFNLTGQGDEGGWGGGA